METVKETTTKPIQAKLKEENKEAKSASGSNDVKNRGWPKGKKRYPNSQESKLYVYEQFL